MVTAAQANIRIFPLLGTDATPMTGNDGVVVNTVSTSDAVVPVPMLTRASNRVAIDAACQCRRTSIRQTLINPYAALNGLVTLYGMRVYDATMTTNATAANV